MDEEERIVRELQHGKCFLDFVRNLLSRTVRPSEFNQRHCSRLHPKGINQPLTKRPRMDTGTFDPSSGLSMSQYRDMSRQRFTSSIQYVCVSQGSPD
ncbi:hypothetical protein BRADI_1g72453v3 [Brachypodium distachyon]|uniref:Uncharacterized protein n=1 Tax=Brachypodium distachyon TaxID=15368 RepID=A0A2K2DUS1_BRADI|nr:hypothetical protein BRADI_1g72453v3 [Brachypodium distachyon]